MEENKNLQIFQYGALFLIILHIAFLGEGVVYSPSPDSLFFTITNGLKTKFFFIRYPLINVLPVLILVIYYIGTETQIDISLSIEVIKMRIFIGIAGIVVCCVLISFIPINSIVYVSYLFGLSVSYVIFILGLSQIRRLIFLDKKTDVFNREKETFPQTLERIDTPDSANIPYYFYYEKKWQRGWINLVNLYRSVLVSGAPGAGKSFGTINLIIHQLIHKGYTMFVYDFKLPTLALEAFNALWHYSQVLIQKHGSIQNFEKETNRKFPKYYQINFSDIAYTHRINPISSRLIPEKVDAQEAAKFIMEGLKGVKKEGGGSADFFNLSAENLLTADIYYLKTTSETYGFEFCSLPHVIEMLINPYEILFSLLMGNIEVRSLAQSFNAAFEKGVMEQLQGQVDSLVIPMGQLINPNIYYVFTGEDFDLNINDPKNPSILVIGNDPARKDIYGIFLSLLNGKLTKIVNQQGRLPLALVLDEFPTLPFGGVTALIATARSNKVATILGIQDQSQFVSNYGQEKAKEIINMVGSVLTGQVRGELADTISKAIGEIKMESVSTSIGKDVSFTVSENKGPAVPVATLNKLQQGEMVGTLADDFKNPIIYRQFHGKIDAMAPDATPTTNQPFKDIPIINKKFKPKENESAEDCQRRKAIEVQRCLTAVKNDIRFIQALEMARFVYINKDEGVLLRKNFDTISTYYQTVIPDFLTKDPETKQNVLSEIGQEWYDKMGQIQFIFEEHIAPHIVTRVSEGLDTLDANDNIVPSPKQFFKDFKNDPRIKMLKPHYDKIRQLALEIL